MELTNEEKEMYDKKTKHLRNMLVQVRRNPFLSKEEKEKQIAELNAQYEQLKKDFVRRLSQKQKYNRTLKKRLDRKEIGGAEYE